MRRNGIRRKAAKSQRRARPTWMSTFKPLRNHTIGRRAHAGRRPPNTNGVGAAVDGVERATEEASLRLDTMPPEMLYSILCHAHPGAVVAAGMTCHALAALAFDDPVWRVLYARDMGRTCAPEEHRDHRRHGKGFLWLYVVGAAEARLNRDRPSVRTGGRWDRLVTCVRSTESRTQCSGEFSLNVEADGRAHLALDGYGSRIERDDAGGLTSVAEGVWRRGQFVGPGRRRWAPGKSPINYPCVAAPDVPEPEVPRCGIYSGDFNEDGDPHGYGVYDWDNGPHSASEWEGNACNGRCVWTHGEVQYAGQVKGNFRVGYGVKHCYRHDSNTESFWGPGNSAWRITRRGASNNATAGVTVKRKVDHNSISTTVRHDGTVVYGAGDGYDRIEVTDDDGGGGRSVAIVDGARVRFVAVSDTHPDRRLAGLRFVNRPLRSEDAAAAAATAAEGDGNPFLGVPIATRDTPSFDLYVRSPQCILPAAAVDPIERADGAHDSMTGMDVEDARLLGMPFGEVIRYGGGVCVRCFLTGRAVPPSDCCFVSSGRLYQKDALKGWMDEFGAHGTVDPETAETLSDKGALSLWRPWMEGVPPPVLANAIRQLYQQCHGYLRRCASNRIRLAVAKAMGALVPRTMSDLVLPAIARGRLCDIDVGSQHGAPLIRGFDGLCCRNVEWRHPEWNPRGPWRLGAPAEPPRDDTVGDHERAGVGPTDHFESHGIVYVALTSPSFLGADMRDTFFFGQRFERACFAGARLDRCAFVGCRFVDAGALDGATFANCGFYDCRMVCRDGRILEMNNFAEMVEPAADA